MGTGGATSNREPRACFRGFPNAIGNAIGALVGVSTGPINTRNAPVGHEHLQDLIRERMGRGIPILPRVDRLSTSGAFGIPHGVVETIWCKREAPG